jgi:prepilin-type processing-associated H-X9-DG protein
VPFGVVCEGDIQYPAQTPLMWDGQASQTPPPILLPALVHNDVMNVGFCDGHVKAIKDPKTIGAGNDYCLGVP